MNESDASRIALAAEQASRKVRSFRPGANAVAWSRLLDEIQAAKETLLDPARRCEYNESLSRAVAGAPAAKPAAARPAAPVNEDLYPPGMTRPAPSPAEASRSEKTRGTSPVEKRDRPLSDLDPPMRRSEAAGAPAAPSPTASRPIPVNSSAPLADALPPASQPAYAAPVEMPTAGLPLGMPAGPYAAGGPMAPLAAPVAHPMQPYAAPAPMAYPAGYPTAQMPYAPASLDPMAPVAIPGMALPTGYAAAPYPAPVAQTGGYISGPMPLGAPLPAASAPAYAAPAAAETQAELLPARSKSGAALARKHEAKSHRGMVIAGVSVALMLLASALAYVAITNLNEPEKVAQDPSPPAVPIVPVGGDVQPIERSAESKLIRPTKVQEEHPQPVPMPQVDQEPALPAPQPMPTTAPAPMPAPPPPAPAPLPDPVPPAPAPIPDPPLPMVSRAELMDLAQSLTTAKVALGEMNFQEADVQLAKADSLAKLPKHREMVARLKEVAGYVQQFRQALAAAAMELQGGDVFMVGNSTQVAFVEGRTDRVILRISGMNRQYPFNDMPAGLAVAMADLKLAGADPVSRVVKGAYLLVHKRPTDDAFAKAKAWWEEAELGGVDLKHLMPFLSDDYDELVIHATAQP
jgi:hypothetical protein